MDKKKYYITTAIAYTSKVPHIGNTYEAILADAIARFRRLEGYDVYFLTGTDEHGQKIEEQAKQAGISPKEHVDHIAGEIRRIWDRMNISYDQFIRTTDPKHTAVVQKIFKRLYEQGDIYKGSYEGLYCTPCESFFTEGQADGGNCPDCGAPLGKASEEAYFFKLSKYAGRLMAHIEAHPEFIQPEARKNEMINNFLKPGLQDLCVSRTAFTWGIPVDFAPGHIVYVWIDALSNYITALDYDTDSDKCGELYSKYWPADVHLIGKDIIRFHTIYWPIMLLALGEPLPLQVFGHPWMLVGEEKMSKSKGNVIYADTLVDFFGVDAVRYFSLHEMPFAQDGTITYELMISRINSDLANILGNLVNRTVAMVHKYFGGVLPAPGAAGELDGDLRALASQTAARVQARMQALHVADALGEIWALLRRSNKYIDETMPWILARDEGSRERLGTVLYNLVESIRIAAGLLAPFLPETAERIFAQLNQPRPGFAGLCEFGLSQPGVALSQPVPLFERLDEQKTLAAISERLEKASQTAPSIQPLKEEIDIDTFGKSDLRVAVVKGCERVPKSDKLLCFSLDMGEGKPRQVVSGIAKFYADPAELVGRRVVVVANLRPVKLRGVESCGMLLTAERADGQVRLLHPDNEAAPGSVVC